MKKLTALAVIGLVSLGLLYKFRHPIEHFHLHFRFRTLEAVNVSPSSSTMPQGSRKKFTAIARYRDGSQAELVSEVAWTSSNPAVAPIDGEGIATAANEGTSTLQATFQRASATTTITVVAAAPVALAISPADPTINVHGNSQFKILATRSDDSVEDVTNRVNWTSSNSAVAKIAPSGLAHGQAQGNSAIGAELLTPLGKIQTATRLTVASTTSPLAGVYSYRYDNTGTAQNRFETLLTPRNVNAATFGKLFAARIDGYVYAQPLYVSHVDVAGRGIHDVVYAATENDTIFAIDADTGAELFRSNLGPAVPKDQLPCPDMGPQIGITGTPVIDPMTHTLYVAAKTFSSGGTFFHLHALDLASGKEKDGSPALITATLPGTGTGKRNGTVTFDARPQLQRPGLVLVNGQVIIAFGSICDRGAFHGWVFAYDASSLKRAGVFLTTPNGSHGGIWQAGGTPVVDPQGNLYVITGDGEFDAYDGGPDYGDTFLKLRSAGNDAIVLTDYFTPFDQKEMDVENVDLGASGPMILPDQSGQYSHILFGAGKNGSMYLINRDDMGHFQSSSNSQIVQYIPHVFPTKIHVSAAYWRNSTSEWIYAGPVEGALQAFPLSRARLSPTASSQTPTVFGYPGALPVISSNGDSDGIVWALENYSGVLHAFDATNLSTELYNSKQAPNGRDAAEHGVQFYAPMVANGKVYFGTRGHLYAYGLLH
ncbi:MAG: Ig-like domain-containing protein [Candidatus Acidiferrales bacterium]